jgi:hypothetical protein
MLEQPEHDRHSRTPLLALIGVITICAIAEVVTATSVPEDLHNLQDQIIQSKQAKMVKYDAPFLISEKVSSTGNGTSHKGDKIRIAEFMAGPDLPEGLTSFMDGAERPVPPRPPRFLERSPPSLAPRSACLEDINRQMAIYGYTKSKLQLSENQKAAWKVLEDAVDTSAPKLRALCEIMSNDVVSPPTVEERYDFLEKHLAARLDLVRALKIPIQQLLAQ